MNSGYGCIRDEVTGESSMYWFDMTTDGGGWAVVAEQSLYESHGYPIYVLNNAKYTELPDGNRSNVKSVRVTNWPRYTEYGIKNLVELNGITDDGSLTEGFWKNNTGSFGKVQCDMVGFYLNKTDYQGGKASDSYVTFEGTPWGDSNPHFAYSGYRWYNQNNITYNWWGQEDMWGHLIDSDIFRVASTVVGFGRPTSCGTSWADDACRLGRNNWVHRATVKHKAVFMVR